MATINVAEFSNLQDMEETESLFMYINIFLSSRNSHCPFSLLLIKPKQTKIRRSNSNGKAITKQTIKGLPFPQKYEIIQRLL